MPADAPIDIFDMREMNAASRPANKAEAELFDVLSPRGWWLHRRGWPDFLCTINAVDRQITIAVEVKRHPEDGPREDQRYMMQALEAAGIPCFVWNRHTGFARVGSGGRFIGDMRPKDTPCPDPALPRCETCFGGGELCHQETRGMVPCDECGGTGLMVPQIGVVR